MANFPVKSEIPMVVSGSSLADFDATDRMYIVEEGDTLSSIARKFYGRARARSRILAANRSLIRDPFFVQPGWRLRIPR